MGITASFASSTHLPHAPTFSNHPAMESPQSHAFRSAVAMQNIGVELLRRGRLPAAQGVFQDAVLTMKGAFVASSQDECSEKLNAAGLRLSRCNVKPQLDVMTFDPSSGMIYSCSGNPALVPMRIEVAACTGLLRFDPDLESALILRNFGITNYMLAHKIPTLSETLFRNAFRIWQLALDLLTRRVNECDHETAEVNLLSMAILVIEAILQALDQESDNGDISQDFKERHQYLTDRRTEIIESEWFRVMMVKTAAEAA